MSKKVVNFEWKSDANYYAGNVKLAHIFKNVFKNWTSLRYVDDILYYDTFQNHVTEIEAKEYIENFYKLKFQPPVVYTLVWIFLKNIRCWSLVEFADGIEAIPRGEVRNPGEFKYTLLLYVYDSRMNQFGKYIGSNSWIDAKEKLEQLVLANYLHLKDAKISGGDYPA